MAEIQIWPLDWPLLTYTYIQTDQNDATRVGSIVIPRPCWSLDILFVSGKLRKMLPAWDIKDECRVVNTQKSCLPA